MKMQERGKEEEKDSKNRKGMIDFLLSNYVTTTFAIMHTFGGKSGKMGSMGR